MINGYESATSEHAIEDRDGSDVEPNAGSLFCWRPGWRLPDITSRRLGATTLDTAPDAGLLARLADLPKTEVVRRLNEGHRVFLLCMDGQPVSYGWSASKSAEIGGLNLTFRVPRGERYLWDFLTLPDYRGRGLYPRLLQEVVRYQAGEAGWFWIAHEPYNLVSRRGILKAGFKLAGQLRPVQGGRLGFVGSLEADAETVRRGARALGLELIASGSESACPG